MLRLSHHRTHSILLRAGCTGLPDVSIGAGCIRRFIKSKLDIRVIVYYRDVTSFTKSRKCDCRSQYGALSYCPYTHSASLFAHPLSGSLPWMSPRHSPDGIGRYSFRRYLLDLLIEPFGIHWALQWSIRLCSGQIVLDYPALLASVSTLKIGLPYLFVIQLFVRTDFCSPASFRLRVSSYALAAY